MMMVWLVLLPTLPLHYPGVIKAVDSTTPCSVLRGRRTCRFAHTPLHSPHAPKVPWTLEVSLRVPHSACVFGWDFFYFFYFFQASERANEFSYRPIATSIMQALASLNGSAVVIHPKPDLRWVPNYIYTLSQPSHKARCIWYPKPDLHPPNIYILLGPSHKPRCIWLNHILSHRPMFRTTSCGSILWGCHSSILQIASLTMNAAQVPYVLSCLVQNREKRNNSSWPSSSTMISVLFFFCPCSSVVCVLDERSVLPDASGLWVLESTFYPRLRWIPLYVIHCPWL